MIWAKGWRDNDLSLSSDATAALRADDLVAGSATAISTPSGAWGIRADGVAAIAASVAQNNRANYGTVVIAH